VNSTETPGGSGIPAGWYDDPSGQGLRWWDGEQWTEHVHTAESAAAALAGEGGAAAEREAPPRELVRLRESIRGRGAKGVGVVLGAAVLVVVVIALLVSGGGSGSGGGEPGGEVPGAAKVGRAHAAATIKRIDRRLTNKELSKAKRRRLLAAKRKLERASRAAAKGKGNSAKAKAAGQGD
jgi:hypothetical protein